MVGELNSHIILEVEVEVEEVQVEVGVGVVVVAVTLVVLTQSAMSVVNQAILLVSAGSVEVQENAGVAVPLDIGGAQAMVKGEISKCIKLSITCFPVLP